MRLHSLILSGAAGEIVKVEKMGKFIRYLVRSPRKAKGLKTHSVEYYSRLDETFEAYLFVLPKRPWNIWGQTVFVVPVDELDKARTKVA